MRVNVYAEEMTDRIEVISKTIDGREFTGIRFYTELPATKTHADGTVEQVKGPFVHHPGDDDSSAVTFWGKKDLRHMLRLALARIDEHYRTRENQSLGTFSFGSKHSVTVGELQNALSNYPPTFNIDIDATGWENTPSTYVAIHVDERPADGLPGSITLKIE